MLCMSPEEEHRSTQKLFIHSVMAGETTIKQYYNQVLAIGYYVTHVNLKG